MPHAQRPTPTARSPKPEARSLQPEARSRQSYPMNLSSLQAAWNDLATRDAMSAVLTGPGASKRAWDREAFFRTGVEEIAFILERVRLAGAALHAGRALDFGCGLGRLTQALGGRFERVDG